MDVLIMIAQLLLGLSILVGLHELGHLVAARVFGMRVEKYSIGFPPKIFGIKIGQTEYSLGALPLGGFVKISGMIDESLDMKQMQSVPKPYEYRSKPAWQRLIVMMGGIIVNIITGVLIFIFIKFLFTESYYKLDEVNKYGVYVSELGEEIGLQKGDKIIKVNGESFENFNLVRDPNVLLDDGSYYTVLRNGEEIDIPIPVDFIARLSEENAGGFVFPLQPFSVDWVVEKSPADSVGLKGGDYIVEVANQPVQYFQELVEVLRANKGEFVNVKVLRGADTLSFMPQITDKGTLGFKAKIEGLEPSYVERSFMESIPIGTKEAFGIITVQIKGFRKIFNGDIPVGESIGGPIEIAQAYGGEWNWFRFWFLTGMLSMVLAFMNFLPIPALDGGHVMFLTYEIVSGRPPSDRFLEGAQKLGMVLLLSLMAFVIGNGVYKVILGFFE